jgi:hypothetical protein
VDRAAAVLIVAACTVGRSQPPTFITRTTATKTVRLIGSLLDHWTLAITCDDCVSRLVVCDPDNLSTRAKLAALGAESVSGIKEIEMLTPGDFGLGTRWRETREVLGRRDSAEMEVTSFERNRTYTITHHKFGTRIDAVFGFEATDRGTKVTIEFDLESPGMPPGILAPLGWAIAGKVREASDTTWRT